MPIRWPWLTPPPEPPDPEAVERERVAHENWIAAAVGLRAVLAEIDETVVAAEREDPER